MISLQTITRAPISAAGLSSLNLGASLPVLSSGTLPTLNGWKNMLGAGVASMAGMASGIGGMANMASMGGMANMAGLGGIAGMAAMASQATTTPQAVAPTPQPASQPTPQPAAAPQVSAIPFHAKPTFTNPLKKGQKTTLNMTSPVLDIRLGLNTNNPECDVDVSAFLVGQNGKVLDDAWFVFYGQPLSPDSSTNFTVLSDETDRQKITIDTSKLSNEVAKIIFVLSINEAAAKSLNFSMVSDAYLRILDATGNEICSYEMEDYYNNVVSMVIGEVYKHNDSWKFNPVGNGMAKDLGGLCELYGVSVE